MGYKIDVHCNGQVHSIDANGNDLLLHALRKAGFEIYAPCGGNGTCGKCKVWIKGEGSVSSCAFPISQDMEVILPDRRESQILVAQHQNTIKLPFQPGPCAELSSYPHGIAIDIGTTSVVLYLVNLITGHIVETRAMNNPQANYGADVISRINYAAQKKGGLKELQQVIVNAINSQLLHFAKVSDIRSDDIVKISIAGNTTMLHLLLGVDPLPIALAPFTPGFTDSMKIDPQKAGFLSNPKADVWTLPCVSAYVGADIVAGLASIQPRENQVYLFMDIGTNGELALATPEKVFCCATAAGPAFEGARIQYGMTAVEGAISAFDKKGCSVIGNVPPTGICGSGLIDIIAYLLDNGHIDADGLMQEPFEVARGSGGPIILTQQDVREVQLAKSAIAAGVNILISRAGIRPEEIDVVYLAGGFGNYFNIDSAMRIGLISRYFKDKVIPLGNTSGTGAILDIKSTAFKEIMDKLLARTCYIELSMEEDFTMEFAMNMSFEP